MTRSLLPIAILLLTSALQACTSRSTTSWAHEHHRLDLPAGGQGGLLIPDDEHAARLAVPGYRIASEHGFTEAILSFNATVPDGAGLVALAQVSAPESLATPPLRIASWGTIPEGRLEQTTAEAARVAIDELLLGSSALATELTVSLVAFEPGGQTVSVKRVDVVLSRDDPNGSHKPSTGSPIDAGAPFRPCPIDDNPDLSSRLCSPTSLSMLLAHRGPEPDYRQLIETILDPVHDIYGVWPRAIQTAYTFGVPGRLHRFGSWDEVRRHLAETGPIAISITAPRGTLSNAPYSETAGHLIVLTGLTEDGDAIVLDPAAGTESEARRVYSAADLSDVWLDRKRGTAYVLLPVSQ